MVEYTLYEIEARQWMERALVSHKWRVDNWKTIEHLWLPEGLTCPKCAADHCEVDGHYCQ
jgi:hypothetical protein